MNDYGELIDEHTLRFVRDLPGPIDRVWSYLTEPDKRAQWLAGGDTSTEPGGTVDYDFDNLSLTPHDEQPPEKYMMPDNPNQTVSFSGKVILYDPPNLLKTTWPDRHGGDGYVTFRLEENGQRVTLEVLHENITDRGDRLGAAAGWHVHLNILADKMTGTVPAPFWKVHTKLEAEYERKLP